MQCKPELEDAMVAAFRSGMHHLKASSSDMCGGAGI